jgi:hypothetical protein
MTSVAILPITNPDGQTAYQAISGNHRAIGKTAGEALDALHAQLPNLTPAPFMLLQSFQGDRFFNTAQHNRLGQLMHQWRTARDRDQTLEPSPQQELEDLVDAELEGAINRAIALFGENTAP